MYTDAVNAYKSLDTANNSQVKANKETKAKKSEKLNNSTDGETFAEVVDKKNEAVSVELRNTSNEAIANEIEAKKRAEEERRKIESEVKKLQFPDSEVKFGIHEETERITIKIVDRGTKEVLKEFPQEKTLDLIAKNLEIAGVMVDHKL